MIQMYVDAETFFYKFKKHFVSKIVLVISKLLLILILRPRIIKKVNRMISIFSQSNLEQFWKQNTIFQKNNMTATINYRTDRNMCRNCDIKKFSYYWNLKMEKFMYVGEKCSQRPLWRSRSKIVSKVEKYKKKQHRSPKVITK